MIEAFLSLGSNLPVRLENLKRSKKYLRSEIDILKESSVYETTPWGPQKNQPNFLNQVIKISTQFSAMDLLNFTESIEKRCGREKKGDNGPRIIDIDILIFGSEFIQEENLCIPHKYLTQRAFVLMPLNEISPKLKIPGTKKCVADFLKTILRDEIFQIFSG